MTFDVLVYKVITNYSGSWPSDMGSHTISADNYIHVLLDDVSETFIVKYQASPLEGINILGTLSAGPNLFFGFDGAVTLETAAPYYQWCDGTTLNKVNVLNNFPYAFLSFFPGALECVIAPTCDLEFSSLYTVTQASGPSTADGVIATTATSSNGTIKFSLDPDFDYATAGQLSGTFSGLLPDTYTIYAKDAIGCTDTITIEVEVTTVYGVRHRLDFTDLHHISQKSIRFDIEERAYTGPIEEMCGEGNNPIIVRYEGDRDDGSVALVPSHSILRVLVETEGQYTHLHQQDDRKYRGKLYIGEDFGSLELYHVGYAIAEFHSEPYLLPPYGLEVTFSDQLGEMKNLDFVDLNENKFKGDLKAIKIISEILKKTGLELEIRCGINVFEENMTTDPEDDPLDQVYIDSRIYYEPTLKCSDVLKSILDPFRAQMFQSHGVWWIIRLSDAVGTFPYRGFDFNGDFDFEDEFNPIKELDTPTAVRAGAGAMFVNASQRLEYLRNFGYFAITHNLKKDGNLIDEGRFEAEDIIDLGSGNKTFKNWNATVGQPGTTFGHETVINGNSLGAFYFDFSMANNPQADSILYSVVIPMNGLGKYRFSFQYFIAAKYKVPFIRIAWTLKFHRVSGGYIWLCTAPNGILQYEVTEVLNDLYVSEYDKWQNFEIFHNLDITQDIDSVEISFYAHNHYGRDFAGEAALRAFDLGALENPLGVKRYMLEAGETYAYTSYYSDEADAFPDVVRPDNFTPGSGGRDWLWKLDSVMSFFGANENVSLVTRTKFDNVALAFYPLIFTPITQYIDPQETLTYSRTENTFVESDFTKDVLLGDMIRYNNEFERNERNIYRAYFRYADGTPTQFWGRSGVAESKNILQILLEDYIGQFSEPQRKLTGQKMTNTVLHFVNCLRDNEDGTRYRPLTFEFDVLNASYTPDMCAVMAGEDGDPPLVPGEFECSAFSSAFNRGACLVVLEDDIFDESFDESFN